MNKLFNWLTGDLFKSIGGVLDELFTSEEERTKAKNEILALLISEGAKLDELKASIIQEEAKGNFLQRSWRPILMLGFGFIILYSKFIAPAFNLPNTDLENEFWDLLQIGLGGYVIGRSAEKITKEVAPQLKIKK